jgi:hypothetical protein
LRRAPEQVVVAAGVGRRAFDAHLRPRRVKLLGHDGRESGVRALTHFDVLGDHRHDVVGTDTHEGIWLEAHFADDPAPGLARPRHGGECMRQVDSERESAKALQEAAAACILDAGGGHVAPPHASAFAASWMAARMRT